MLPGLTLAETRELLDLDRITPAMADAFLGMVVLNSEVKVIEALSILREPTGVHVFLASQSESVERHRDA